MPSVELIEKTLLIFATIKHKHKVEILFKTLCNLIEHVPFMTLRVLLNLYAQVFNILDSMKSHRNYVYLCLCS